MIPPIIGNRYNMTIILKFEDSSAEILVFQELIFYARIVGRQWKLNPTEAAIGDIQVYGRGKYDTGYQNKHTYAY